MHVGCTVNISDMGLITIYLLIAPVQLAWEAACGSVVRPKDLSLLYKGCMLEGENQLPYVL